MSKTISGGLNTHIAGEVTTLATMFKLTRRDGTILGLTSHDQALTYGGLVYTPVNSFDHSSIQTTAGMSVDNLDVLALIDSDLITEAELKSRLYDYAGIEIFIVNWGDLTQGAVILRVGTLGEITVNRSGTFHAELRGRMQPLQETIGRVCGRRCDARLGDTRCGFNLASRTQSGTVVSSSNRATFEVSGITDDIFNGGLVTWTSGLNDGQTMEVKLWTNSPGDTVELFLPMDFNIQAGDAFTMSVGCDRNLSTCRDEFDNVDNFRGFPDIPGRDSVLSYPDSPV